MCIRDSSKRIKICQNVSKRYLFEPFWSPWAPQNSSFSLYFQVGNPLFLRVGCVFRLKSHEILRNTRGFSLFETGETLYFTSPNAVFLVIFAAVSKENAFFHPQSNAKTRVLGYKCLKRCKYRALGAENKPGYHGTGSVLSLIHI